MAVPPADGGGGGSPRSGASRSGVTRQTPQLDAMLKWLNEVASTRVFDLGGVSDLSREKIAYGLEAHGRPVLKVTPYMTKRVVETAQKYIAKTTKPSKVAFWDEVEKTALAVVIERIANAGGDLKSEWANHPLSPAYKAAKAKKYPGKPMGQASGKLLGDLRSTRAFSVRGRQ